MCSGYILLAVSDYQQFIFFIFQTPATVLSHFTQQDLSCSNGCTTGFVNFIDDKHIRHTDVCFARKVFRLMPGAVRVGNHNQQVGGIEGEVVVAAVPEDDVGLLLGAFSAIDFGWRVGIVVALAVPLVLLGAKLTSERILKDSKSKY
mgnify:CR=1 FL=1